jgi:TPR repeat protein
MRTFSVLSSALLATALGVGAAAAFELKDLNDKTPPAEALNFGMSQYKSGDTTTAVEALNYAAGKGNAGAQWKLGDMYADGDGVPRDEYRAFELFSEVARHAGEDTSIATSPYVSNAFVRLGTYYRDGIPNSTVKPDPNRARQIYDYAASVFGNAEAQLNLARMYYSGEGGDRDLIKALKWARHAADKGKRDATPLMIDICLNLAQQSLEANPANVPDAVRWARQATNYGSVEGQALLGHLLFEGDGITRQPVDGLTLLTIALARSNGKSAWIAGLHEDARAAATQDEWNAARQRADQWLATQPVLATADPASAATGAPTTLLPPDARTTSQ